MLNFSYSQMDDKTMIVCTESTEAIVLDSSGTMIFELWIKGYAKDEIVSSLSIRFPHCEAQIKQDVYELLDLFFKYELMV